MLNADVNTFFDVSVADNLVDDDTNGMRGYVVNDTSASACRKNEIAIFLIIADSAPVVVFVRHTPLHGRVSLDVDNVSYAVVDEVCRESDTAML